MIVHIAVGHHSHGYCMACLHEWLALRHGAELLDGQPGA